MLQAEAGIAIYRKASAILLMEINMKFKELKVGDWFKLYESSENIFVVVLYENIDFVSIIAGVVYNLSWLGMDENQEVIKLDKKLS